MIGKSKLIDHVVFYAQKIDRDLKDAIIKGLGIQSGNLNLFGFDLKVALVAQSLECDLQAVTIFLQLNSS
ncbi:hypothetical protein LXL04_000505 [Taraxacum kok-saghyz]